MCIRDRIGLDAVNLEQAVRDANVPRSSAYAAWSNEGDLSPQAAFQRAVLCEVLESRKRKLEALARDSLGALTGFATDMPRRAKFRELIRRTAKTNLANSVESMEGRIAVALRSVLFSVPEELRDEELVRWLTKSSKELREVTIAALYRPIAEAFEIVPRPEYGDSAFALCEIAISAITEGITSRCLDEEPTALAALVHPEGAEGEWSVYTLMCEKAVETFFIPAKGTWDDY